MIDWTPGLTLEAVEKMCIQQAFKFYRGNKTTTANSLGIAIRTLDNKLEKYESEDRDRILYVEGERARQKAQLERARGNGHFQIPSSIPGPHAGISVEPAAQVSDEQKMSLPEWKEVQKVLPRQAGKNRYR